MRRARNVTFIALGLLLVIVAVAGNFAISRLLRPPTFFVLAAKEDIPVGEAITPANTTFIALTNVSPQELEKYILETEVELYGGLRTRENIRAGSIILREHLALDIASDDPEIARMLNNPENTMVLLASAVDSLPNFISVGDRVNIFITLGGSFSGSTLPNVDATPTPTPNPGSIFQEFLNIGTPTPQAGAATPTPAEGSENQQPVVIPGETPTPTPFPQILYPAIQPLLENVPIAFVGRDENGTLSRIGVVVPRTYQSALIIADRANALALTLSGPTARPFTNTIPLRPFSYNDIVEIFRYQLAESIRRGELITFTLFPGYIDRYYPDVADSIRATQDAWLAREKKPVGQEMDEIIRGRP